MKSISYIIKIFLTVHYSELHSPSTQNNRQWRVTNKPNIHVFGWSEKDGVPGENPHRNGENMQKAPGQTRNQTWVLLMDSLINLY